MSDTPDGRDLSADPRAPIPHTERTSYIILDHYQEEIAVTSNLPKLSTESFSASPGIHDALWMQLEVLPASMPQQVYTHQPSLRFGPHDNLSISSHLSICTDSSQLSAEFCGYRTTADLPQLPRGSTAVPHNDSSVPSKFGNALLNGTIYEDLEQLSGADAPVPSHDMQTDPHAAHCDNTAPNTTTSVRHIAPPRRLLHALAGLTGTCPVGDVLQKLTGSQVVEAIKAGKAYISRNTPINEQYAASTANTGYDIETSSKKALENSMLVSEIPTYAIQVGGGWIINAPFPADLVEPPFIRHKGGGRWCPPEGLIYAASEKGMRLKNFSLDGAFSPIYSQAAPGQADVRLIGSTPVTACELVTWFPTHYVAWEDWCKRLAGNGWTATNIARLANKARGTDETLGLTKTPIENQFANRAPVGDRPKVTVFTLNGWKDPINLDLTDYCLKYLATGVARSEFPTGLDRGPLTETIEYALDHQEYESLKLSDVEQFVAVKGLDTTSAFMATSLELNPDEQAIRRLKPDLERYRVLCLGKRPTSQ